METLQAARLGAIGPSVSIEVLGVFEGFELEFGTYLFACDDDGSTLVGRVRNRPLQSYGVKDVAVNLYAHLGRKAHE